MTYIQLYSDVTEYVGHYSEIAPYIYIYIWLHIQARRVCKKRALCMNTFMGIHETEGQKQTTASWMFCSVELWWYAFWHSLRVLYSCMDTHKTETRKRATAHWMLKLSDSGLTLDSVLTSLYTLMDTPKTETRKQITTRLMCTLPYSDVPRFENFCMFSAFVYGPTQNRDSKANDSALDVYTLILWYCHDTFCVFFAFVLWIHTQQRLESNRRRAGYFEMPWRCQVDGSVCEWRFCLVGHLWWVFPR